MGDATPQSLLDTMLYMNGLYFAVRGGKEHRILRHKPSQIKLIEKHGERPYLMYTKDLSKNHPGGLKGRKSNQKLFTTMPILRNLKGVLYIYTSYTTAAVLPIVPIMHIIYNLIHEEHLMLSMAGGIGPAAPVLAGPVFLKVKTKFHSCKRQVINKSASVILELIKVIILSYNR